MRLEEENTELHHQPRGVHDDAGVLDTTCLQPDDDHTTKPNAPSRGGYPRNYCSRGQVHSNRLATVSPSAICSLMEKSRSENADLIVRRISFKSLQPRGPGRETVL